MSMLFFTLSEHTHNLSAILKIKMAALGKANCDSENFNSCTIHPNEAFDLNGNFKFWHPCHTLRENALMICSSLTQACT